MYIYSVELYVYIVKNSYPKVQIVLNSFSDVCAKTVLEICFISQNKLLDLLINMYMILPYLRHSPQTRKSNVVRKVKQT